MGWNEPDGNKQSRDPWGKRPNNDGPPDLDEALRRFSKKLSGMFGGGGASGDGSAAVGGIGIGIIVLLIFVLWALSGIYIVRQAEEAVILRFGQYVKTTGPGPHWLPRFIDSKYVVNVQKIYDYSYTALMLNKDENIVSVSVAVQYRIADPNQFLFNVVNPRESLQQATASALRQVVGHTPLDNILTTGREQVRQEVSTVLKELLGRYDTGIEITDVAMLPAKAPDEVKDAFDDAIKAQEDEQRYINQAKAYTARVEPIAQGQAKRLVQEADAYRQQVIFQAKGEVAGFLALLPEYKMAPQVTRERLYLDAVSSVLEKTSKVLLDVKSGNPLVYLPLDKIIGRPVDEKQQASESSSNDKSSADINMAQNGSTDVSTSRTRPDRYSQPSRYNTGRFGLDRGRSQ